MHQQGMDASSAQVAFEKWLKKKAEAVWRVMYDEGFTRAEIMIYFRQLGIEVAKYGQKLLERRAEQVPQFQEDTTENSAILGTMERTQEGLSSDPGNRLMIRVEDTED
jgi:hypothetical protein